MVLALFQIADMLLQVVMWIIIIQVIISWLFAFNVINPHSGGVRSAIDALDRITAPIYRPVRRILPDFGGIDFSPLVIILVIQILRKLLAGVAMDLVV
jgi:YggT family protein